MGAGGDEGQRGPSLRIDQTKSYLGSGIGRSGACAARLDCEEKGRGLIDHNGWTAMGCFISSSPRRRRSISLPWCGTRGQEMGSRFRGNNGVGWLGDRPVSGAPIGLAAVDHRRLAYKTTLPKVEVAGVSHQRHSLFVGKKIEA